MIMVNLMIELEDVLTSNSCSVIVIAIIKYIVYNAKQIPFSYEAFTRTMSLHKQRLYKDGNSSDNSLSVRSVREKKAISYLERIVSVFENFEFTFKNLECELWSYNVKEVMLIFGPNLSIPKQVLRIILPLLALGHSILQRHVRKNLLAVFRKLQESKELNDKLFGTSGPTNMFVLVGMSPYTSGPQTAWFQPVDHVNITERIPQTIIRLTNPDHCIFHEAIDDKLQELTKIKSYNWYKSINIIQGFKDLKIDGVSAINVFNFETKI